MPTRQVFPLTRRDSARRPLPRSRKLTIHFGITVAYDQAGSGIANSAPQVLLGLFQQAPPPGG